MKERRYKNARLEMQVHKTVVELRKILAREMGVELSFSEAIDKAVRESLEKRGVVVTDGIIKPWRD